MLRSTWLFTHLFLPLIFQISTIHGRNGMHRELFTAEKSSRNPENCSHLWDSERLPKAFVHPPEGQRNCWAESAIWWIGQWNYINLGSSRQRNVPSDFVSASTGKITLFLVPILYKSVWFQYKCQAVSGEHVSGLFGISCSVNSVSGRAGKGC